VTSAPSDSVPFLDLSAQHDEVRVEINNAWSRVTADNAFVGGAYVERFEAEFAAYCGVSHCIGVANGTDALMLILAALGVAGHEVVVPGNTFVATLEAIVAAGAIPVFVDVDPDTLLVTADAVASAISSRTAAVIVVHLYGQMPDMEAICRVAERAGIAVVEDAAQAHGARWMHRRAGACAHAAAFSFYPGKNLGAFGDAGAVTTNDARLARHIRILANHGRAPSGWHQHDIVGCNSRLDGLQAAILSVKLRHLDEWNAARMAAARHYAQILAGTPSRPVAVDPRATAVHHLQVVRVASRARVLAALDACGVGWGLHYPVPSHRQAAFSPFATAPLPVTEQAAAEVVSLPMFPTITGAQIDRVCEALLAVPEETTYGKAG
jgi:dTDP-4-amino-4,6-dideoxygalactose transaminase